MSGHLASGASSSNVTVPQENQVRDVVLSKRAWPQFFSSKVWPKIMPFDGKTTTPEQQDAGVHAYNSMSPSKLAKLVESYRGPDDNNLDLKWFIVKDSGRRARYKIREPTPGRWAEIAPGFEEKMEDAWFAGFKKKKIPWFPWL